MNDMPWIKSYPEGVRWDIEIERRTRCSGSSTTTPSPSWPDSPALDFMGKRISLPRAEGARRPRREAAAAARRRPRRARRALFLPNTPHYVIAFFGVLKAGGTVVNYSPLDAAKVLEHKIEDSRTDVLVTLDLAALYPQMAAMLGKTRLKKLVVGSLAEMSAAPDAVAAQMKAGKLLAKCRATTAHAASRQLIDNDGAFQASPDRRSGRARSPCCSTPAARPACRRARC